MERTRSYNRRLCSLIASFPSIYNDDGVRPEVGALAGRQAGTGGQGRAKGVRARITACVDLYYVSRYFST